MNRSLRHFLPMIVLFGCSIASSAQSSPAASGSKRRVEVFATGSSIQSAYHDVRLWGYAFGADYQLWRWVSLRGNFQFSIPQSYQMHPYKLSEREFLFGPVVKKRIGRFRPYADFMAGPTKFVYPSTNFNDTEMGFALGGGVDCQLTHRISIRLADVQWGDLAVGSPPIRHPVQLNAGIVVRIF